MKTSNRNRVIGKFALLSVCSVIVIAVGCGSPQNQAATSSAATYYPPAVNGGLSGSACPAGQISIGNNQCMTGDFTQVCNYSGGAITTIGGVQVCRAEMYLNPSYGVYLQIVPKNQYNVAPVFAPMAIASINGLPRLTTEAPDASSALNLGLPLKANDLVVVKADGGWGTASQEESSFLGIPYTSYSYDDCDAIGVDGATSNGVITYNNSPQGLFMGNGAQVAPVYKGTTFRFQAAGTLRFGFNVPTTVQHGCSSARITSLKIVRCQDAAGTTYSCDE